MKRLTALSLCVFAATHTHCIKKMGSQSISGIYSCTAKKGETRQNCTEFRNLNPNEVAYFKQKCDNDSSMDATQWQEAPCTTEARQGGCELKFSDASNNVTTQFTTWGYTASAVAAITATEACEKSGGRVVQP